MAYRNKTYIAFDADEDMTYYRTLQMWKSNPNIDFEFYDAHDINNLRKGSSEETIKGKLRERLRNSRVLILIVGEHTKYLYKYVKWELEIAQRLNIPIIVANLNKKNGLDDNLCPKIVRDELAVHGPFSFEFLNHAVHYWPDSYKQHKYNDDNDSYYYNDFN